MPGRARIAALALAGACALSCPAPASAGPVGAHSMMQLVTPAAAQDSLARDAEAMGASMIRLDVGFEQLARLDGSLDFSRLDAALATVRRHRLKVLAVLRGSPWFAAGCRQGTPFERTLACPPSDLGQWAGWAGQVAGHARGRIAAYEIVNEPDGAWNFSGTPEQYAWMQSKAYEAVKAADPRALVTTGGFMSLASRAWIARAFRTPGANFRFKFDVASVHIRDRPAQAGRVVRAWRAFFKAGGRADAPVWVSESGYPAQGACQSFPGYRGEQGQARWVSDAGQAMLAAGARRIFFTTADTAGCLFDSEGLFRTPLIETRPQDGWPQSPRPAALAAAALASARPASIARAGLALCPPDVAAARKPAACRP